MRNHRWLLTLLTLVSVSAVGVIAEPITSVVQLERAAAAASSPQTQAVLTPGDRPLGIAADFDRSGTLDYAMLTVPAQGESRPTLAELSDRVRLFRAQTEPMEFRLEVFFQRDGALGPPSEVIFGRRVGLSGITLLELSTQESAPLAIRVDFLDPIATEEHLVVFRRDGSLSQMVLSASANERSTFLDVTRDGLLDLLISRRLPEAGRGFETYLDFFVLTDGSYELAASTNIVRNLQSFVATTQRLIEERRWTELLDHAGGPYGEQSVEEQLRNLFAPISRGSEEPLEFVFAEEPLEIQEVVFPQIADNPFRAPFLGESIELTFRVSCCGWEDHLYSAVVELSANPFYGRQYRLLTRSKPRG